MPPEVPPDGAEEVMLETLLSSLNLGLPAMPARQGTWHHVLLAITIFHKEEKQKAGLADQGGHVFQNISHLQVSSLPSDVPRRLKTIR